MMKNCLQTNPKNMYIQCTLRKPSGSDSGYAERTLWANSDKAIVGNKVKVEENDGSWTTDWTVISIHGSALPKAYVQNQSHAYSRQRKASDI